MDHLSAIHPEIDPGKQSEAVFHRCERAIQSAQPCPMCNMEYLPRQLQSHLGRHMQQLAIFALPKKTDESDNEGADEDEEGTEDSILGSFESNPDQSDAIDLVGNLSPFPEAEPSVLVNIGQSDDTKEGVDDPDGERPLTPGVDWNPAPSSHPPSMDNPNHTVDTTEITGEPTRHTDSNLEDPSPMSTAESAVVNEPQPDSPTVSKEQCLSIFEDFIDNQKPGLRAVYKDSDSLAAHAAHGVVIIEKLVSEGCSVETARDLIVLTLYRILILTGLDPSLSVNVW